jgi:DNA polymerase III subunit gamma/tau
MNEYQVIARKWRPQRFSDVVGQEHIIKTLKNAIRQQRTAHAYLFVGPRGIGKTSTARIFAKALNCEAPEDGEPCCKCHSCISIADENNIDVIEIDAASQNSVENIRDLRDEVLHMPINCRYKIYIIDEVHMLSKSAWNALLKTVEEPPAHVKFIFATTEVHMVLATIISRCQRFDLKPISSNLISLRLAEIAAAENVTISSEAISAIARAADGGMRDAQSLLDQMIAFFSGDNKEISEEQVLSLFGLTGSTDLVKIISAIFNNDRGGVVASIHALAVKGKNLETLFSDILNYLRGVQLCHLLSNPEAILESDPDSIKRFRELGANVNTDVIQILMENLSSVGRILHDAINKQVFLETIILKAMRIAHSVKIADLVARLNYLRKAGDLKFLDKIPADTPAPAKTVVTPVEVPVAIPAIPEPVAAPKPEPIPEPVAAPKPEPAAPKPEPAAPKPEPIPEPVAAPKPEPIPEPVAAPKPEPIAAPTPVQKPVPPEPELKFNPMPEAEPVKDEFTPNSLWQQIVKFIKSDNFVDPTIVHYMNEGNPQSFDNSMLTVIFYEEFDAAHYAAVQKILPSIHKAMQKITGDWATTVDLIHKKGVRAIHKKAENEIPEPEPEELALAPETKEKDKPVEPADDRVNSVIGDKEIVDQVKQKEIVSASLDLFGGTIVDIHG